MAPETKGPETRRLYHEDPDLRVFRAVALTARASAAGTWDVVLDATAFYPTGGGQPHDTGLLGGRRVLDVLEEGSVVVHRVEGPLEAGPVEGEVDWPRRLDHREQHTGQHILSRALLEVAGAATVGFHLGEERVTVDLDRADIPEDVLERAEERANAMVRADVPVSVEWYDDASKLPGLIRREAAVTGPVRVISVGDFDVNPCCGTHCRRSGEVGPIKILRLEKKKGGTRVEFVCGARALGDYRRRHRVLRAAALSLTAGEFEVPVRVRALQADLKESRARLEKAEVELRESRLQGWLQLPPGPDLGIDVGEGRVSWLPGTASALAAGRSTPVLAYSREGDEVRMAVAVPEGGDAHAGDLLKGLLAGAGGRGGGSARLGQGLVPAAALPAVLATWSERGRAPAPAQETKS